LLFLQGNEYLKARDLVQAAAAQYGLSGSEYCDLMRRDSYWGGGPEIVVGFYCSCLVYVFVCCLRFFYLYVVNHLTFCVYLIWMYR
jgi:hypothetical protein